MLDSSILSLGIGTVYYADIVQFTPAGFYQPFFPQRSDQGSELFTLDLPVSITVLAKNLSLNLAFTFKKYHGVFMELYLEFLSATYGDGLYFYLREVQIPDQQHLVRVRKNGSGIGNEDLGIAFE